MSIPFPPQPGAPSPWGAIDRVRPLGPDAVIVATASHGGVCLSPAALDRLPPGLRQTAFSQGGWFEEDCDWAIPYLALRLHRYEPDPALAARVRLAAWRIALGWPSARLAALRAALARGPSDV